jgi:hypothetical protein
MEKFIHIKNEIIEDSNTNKNRIISYIINGYMPYSSNKIIELAKENPDEGLQKYSDDKIWEQYKSGKISREEVVKVAIDKVSKEIDIDTEEKLKKLESIIAAPTLLHFSLYIERFKIQAGCGSKVGLFYGDAYAELRTKNKTYTNEKQGHKEERFAISNVLNQCDSVIKILCEYKEKALITGISDEPTPIWAERDNGSIFGVGVETGAIPKFRHQGVDFGSFFSILKKCGYHKTVVKCSRKEFYVIVYLSEI